MKVEPTPVCQILTDYQDGGPLIWCLERFMKQEQKRYGFKAKTVLPLFICDVSWAIIKTALEVFHNETLPQYVDRCFYIVRENVLSHQISQDFINLPFTFYESGFEKCRETHKKLKYPFCYVFD